MIFFFKHFQAGGEFVVKMAALGNPYPNVFMVDTHTAYPPPLPPKPLRYRKRSVVQPMLLVLVALALCGMVVEACFIYRLYSKHPQVSSPFFKRGTFFLFNIAKLNEEPLYYFSHFHHFTYYFLIFCL